MPDKYLIKSAQAGESTAPERIVHEYYDEIYRYLYRKFGNSFDAQDVTQEVFVKFFSSIHSYSERGKLRNYLFKLAANASNDVFRKSVKSVSLDEVTELQDISEGPAESAQRKDDKQAVRDALQSLPSFQRDVIILRFYHDMPFADIAKITDSNISSAKSRYRQGMEKLKKVLEASLSE